MEDILYVGINGEVLAIDVYHGKELWQTSLKSGFFGSKANEDVTLLVDRGVVFAGCHGNLFALDGESGKILWQNKLKGLGENDVSLAMERVIKNT